MTTLADSPRVNPGGAATRPAPSTLRVLHVLPGLHGGGMERGLVRQVRSWTPILGDDALLPTVEHHVCVLGGGDDELLDACRRVAPLHRLGMTSEKRLRGRMLGWLGLRRIIRRHRPHIVHARSTGTWSDASLAVRGLPVRLVLGFHGQTGVAPPPIAKRCTHRLLARRADAVVAVSHHAAAALIERYHVPPHKLRVIPNGVDTLQFRPAGGCREIESIRRRLDLPVSAPLAVCVANLQPVKGHDVLLTAWRQVCMVHPTIQLLLVGDGPERERLEDLSATLRLRDHVRFVGRRGDVADWLRAADLFVLPSRYEGCSNAVLEAMASGLPVIAGHVGGNAELVSPQHTGWLIEPDSPQRLAGTLVDVFMDQGARHRVGAAAREAVSRHFSMEVCLRRHAELYCRLRPDVACPREAAPCAV